LELPFTERTYEAPGYLVREGATRLEQCSFIRSGYAFRQKLTVDGNRQIVGICLPGDFVDLQHIFLDRADHSVQVLTRAQTADVDRTALQRLAEHRPNLNKALWIDTLIEASIHREWILNVGRRDARQRIANLLCEFALRMKQAGIDPEAGCELPMTQEQLGDAVGLTSVHVNRMLKTLEKDGLVQREKRHLTIFRLGEDACARCIQRIVSALRSRRAGGCVKAGASEFVLSGSSVHSFGQRSL